MESMDIYNKLFGKEYFNIDIDPSYDLNVIKNVCILFIYLFICTLLNYIILVIKLLFLIYFNIKYFKIKHSCIYSLILGNDKIF